MDVILGAYDVRLLQVNIECTTITFVTFTIQTRFPLIQCTNRTYIIPMKSYTNFAASPSSNLSRLDVTLCTVSLYLKTIHWSAKCQIIYCWNETFIIIRKVHQYKVRCIPKSLLAKLRLASTRSI